MLGRVHKWVPFAALGLFPLAAGCDGGGFALEYHDHRPPPPVYVEPVHVCTHECHHHYWDGGKLVVLKGHRHGPGCGHVFEGGHWVLFSAGSGHLHVDAGPVHICTHECHHHFWDGGKLVVLKGHRHGPGCGHHFDGRHWVVVAGRPDHLHVEAGPVHICTHDCHHHYWDGTKLVMLKGHRHGPGCGHVFKDSRWVLVGKGPAKAPRKGPPPRRVKKGP